MSHVVAIVGGRGAHARAYAELDGCEVVAVANPTPASGRAFAETHGIERVFEDHVEMVRAVEPDVVSVVTPEPTHAEIVIDLAETAIPGAIHCEKPMAHTFGGAREMVRTCEENDVQLTFHHQFRFKPVYREAKRLIDRGEIGDVERVSYGFPDLFTHGTHSIDLCGMYNDERPAEWVIGGIDYREENVHRGTHNENQAVALWRYDNGVHGLGATQHGGKLIDERAVTGDLDVPYAIHNRVDGTDGTILLVQRHADNGPKYLLYRRRVGEDWEEVLTSGDGDASRLAIADILEAYETGGESELSAANALKTTEILFGVWESSRRRGRVELPLEIEDNPIEDMVESGALQPEPADE